MHEPVKIPFEKLTTFERRTSPKTGEVDAYIIDRFAIRITITEEEVIVSDREVGTEFFRERFGDMLVRKSVLDDTSERFKNTEESQEPKQKKQSKKELSTGKSLY